MRKLSAATALLILTGLPLVTAGDVWAANACYQSSANSRVRYVYGAQRHSCINPGTSGQSCATPSGSTAAGGTQITWAVTGKETYGSTDGPVMAAMNGTIYTTTGATDTQNGAHMGLTVIWVRNTGSPPISPAGS